jgi:hypothetical protein
MGEFTPKDPITMDYTSKAEEVAALRKFQETGTKRHLIGRDSQIAEGMYGGSYGGETIVVDYNSDKAYYDAAIDQVKQRATVTNPDGTPKIDKNMILDSVFQTTKEKLPYNKEGVDRIFQTYGGKDHTKLALSVYMESGAGVCRHQALLAGLMIEKLGEEGILRGHASVDRSIQWPEEGDPGGHAWVRYTNSAEQVFIIDPAQNFIGSLEEAATRQRGWNYLRPGETLPQQSTIEQFGESAVQGSGLIEVPDWIKNPPQPPQVSSAA